MTQDYSDIRKVAEFTLDTITKNYVDRISNGQHFKYVNLSEPEYTLIEVILKSFLQVTK